MRVQSTLLINVPVVIGFEDILKRAEKVIEELTKPEESPKGAFAKAKSKVTKIFKGGDKADELEKINRDLKELAEDAAFLVLVGKITLITSRASG